MSIYCKGRGNKLEKYVIDLFCDASFLPAYTLADARWHLYTKLQDCDKLPPTRAAIRFKVLRSHLMCLIRKSSHCRNLKVPDPEEFGWEKKNGILMPVLTDQPPEAVIEMSLCKCKTGCKCKMNSLVCCVYRNVFMS